MRRGRRGCRQAAARHHRLRRARDRTRSWASTATCGSDTDPDAPCSADPLEVRVAHGRVVAVGPPSAGRLPAGTVALVGRERGAAALRGLAVGTPVTVSTGFEAVGSPPLRVAVGALPLARGGHALPGLQDTERAPRTAVGIAADGRRLWLVTVDGRQDASIGVTLAELARLLTDLGAPVAASLDGGGSTTMVRRGRDEALRIVNDPGRRPRARRDRRPRRGAPLTCKPGGHAGVHRQESPQLVLGTVTPRGGQPGRIRRHPREHTAPSWGSMGRPDRAPCAPGSH